MSKTTKIENKPKVNKEAMKTDTGQVGFYFDQTRCDACYACIVACKDWHDVPPGPANWLRVSTVEKGKYPNLFLAFNVNLCNQCVNAPCVAVCPAEAISKREADGIVVVDREKCQGRDECGYPCSHECPIGNDVLGFVSLIREGKYAEAWRLLAESNPFPGVCGRVCFHPCESACNRSQVDEPIAIQALERLAAEYMPTVPPFAVERKRQRVAIVGSGPAGLACAYHLVLRGYRATVFEALPEAGGMLRVGIPDYRLPKAVLDREIAFIEALGVEIKTNMRVGQNLSMKDLNKFDAVFLAVGTHKEKSPDIPGIDQKEVISGLAFLREAKLNGKVKVGKKVVVLGGGNVAFDCARTALRMGATEVNLVCPECDEDMPAEPSEIKQGGEEGIKIHTSRLACKILGKKEHATGVECLKLRSMEFDVDGKLHFDAIKGSETVLPADTVILAIGQEPDLSFLPSDIKVNRGMISIGEDGATSRQKYFAGGDAAIPERRVAWAIGSGRKAAQAIDRSLRGLPREKSSESTATPEFKLVDTDFIEKKERVSIPVLPVVKRSQNFTEVELGLDNESAKAEANRCLLCRGMCLVACPYNTPQFGVEDNPKMQKCEFCLEDWEQGDKPICVRSCTMRALDAGPIEELRAKYGDIRSAEDFPYHEKSEPAITFKPKTYQPQK
ncbi:FAD-dependent oxidoreductase [Chloroflexota bacterium]